MPSLVFFSGTMDSGKSTLALQTDHNHAARGLRGLILVSRDRAGSGRLSSRLGLEVPALEVGPETDLWSLVVDRLQAGERVDYLICDEAQFYTRGQVDDLARVVDDLGIDVYAFGITTDFRTALFPGSARLIELADRVEVLQVQTLCWCGARATHNARTVDGLMVTEGEQVVVGDVGEASEPGGPSGPADASGPDDGGPVVAYEVLCRRHHRRGQTAAVARAAQLSPEMLPFGPDR